MLLRITASEERRVEYNEELESFFDNFHVPILPKIGVYMNMHALIVSCVTIVILSLCTNAQGSSQLFDLTCLIPCFAIGLACGGMAVACGLLSVQMRDHGPSRGPHAGLHICLVKSSKLFLSASITLTMMSNAIFLAGAGFGLYVIGTLFDAR